MSVSVLDFFLLRFIFFNKMHARPAAKSGYPTGGRVVRPINELKIDPRSTVGVLKTQLKVHEEYGSWSLRL